MTPQDLTKEILSGKLFIYPTDTIYGMGCNALNKKAVEKIRKIKKRDSKPFSIIVPSFKWIEENCIVDVNLSRYLPGPYTIILKKKSPSFLSWVSDKETLGIRIPNHPFCFKIQKAQVPFITTSLNKNGETPANSIEEIKKEILNKVDYIINAGKLSGKPSTLIINGKEVERK